MAADDVVDRPLGRTGQLYPVHALEQRLQHRGCFQARQALSSASVGTVSETDVTARVASDVEDRWVLPFAFVAVGRGIDHQDSCARGDSHASDFGLLRRAPREGAQRWLIADDFIDGVCDEGGFVLERCHWSGWPAKRLNALEMALIVVSIEGAR